MKISIAHNHRHCAFCHFIKTHRHSSSIMQTQTSPFTLIKQTNLLIDGKFVPSISGKTFDTFNPATEKIITSVAEAGTADIDAAVAAARTAFEGPWRTTSASNRSRLINKLADLIEENIDELATLESLDCGKPYAEAKTVDITLVLSTLRYFAGWPDKIHGTVIPIDGPFLCYTKAEPVGVCAQIIPWNCPLIMMAWKLGPALAAGNTIVLKPAELTPLSALRVGELIVEAGFPKGVVNIVPGGAVAGRHLAQHPKVDKVAFTGSTKVGYEIMRTSHANNLKRISLELGGKSANIILDDADIDLAVQQSHLGAFHNKGEICIAGSRVYVQEGIYDEFVRRTVEAASARVVGDPFNAATQQGPQISENQFDKILRYVEKGVKEGARLLTGGKRHGDKGWFIEPTVFADVTDDMVIAREEIFGPVMSIFKFKTIDEVIARANDSNYGLGAGVMTSNLDSAIKISNSIRAGSVYVNCYGVCPGNAPFGGFKDSGVGRENGESGLHNYLEYKTIIIKRPDDAMP
ncbi:putative aldehyde dehydrogenase domain, aldehyde/histidinol dehydrogenase [Plasmopara halstedii]